MPKAALRIYSAGVALWNKQRRNRGDDSKTVISCIVQKKQGKENDNPCLVVFLERDRTKKPYIKVRLVTIVVLIILAGITLNAVIGENGIILQAKDTKNLITNETTYDNQQLAQLQNELKDNGLYSGIGIIPGTDIRRRL